MVVLTTLRTPCFPENVKALEAADWRADEDALGYRMPAAAGDGVNDFGEEKLPVPLPSEDGLLPSRVSSVCRESIRSFQHNKRVGNYLIGRKLGEGSFAKVREGLHVLTGEKVAVKVIDKKKAKKDTYVTKNLRREGQIQQMIRHPNIAQLLDILETENSYYLVMELCPGGNLMHKIYEKRCLEENEARQYIKQLVLAVEHLHRAGVVHRDLKIENLLLDIDDNIKLIDFGLSNCAGLLGYTDPFSTQCGSPAYAAPELLARKKYGAKVDVWSIGVNMYAMLTGTLPFTVEPFSLRALYQKMVEKEMNPLPGHLSPVAINFLRSLLEPDPAKRPNIQQALANRWLNDNFPGKMLHTVTYPNRIHLDSLNQSVVLHMSEKLGYKHSDVINTVLSNRACQTLAVYFLLNQKLQRYLLSIGKPDINDNVCHKNQAHQMERYKVNKNSSEIQKEKRLKETEKREDLLPSPLQKKLDNSLSPYKQASSLAQAQNSRAQLKEKKMSKPGCVEKDSLSGSSPKHEGTTAGCVTSSSVEYLEMQIPVPRTPTKLLRQEQSPSKEPANARNQNKDNHLVLHIVRSFESVNREDQVEPTSPTHQYRILSSAGDLSPKDSCQSTLSPGFLHPGSTTPMKFLGHPTHVSFIYEDQSSPCSSEATSPASPISPISPISPTYNNNMAGPLGSPNCVKSRARFPMMGVGQMMRKKNQVLSPKSEKPLETRMPQLQQMNPGYFLFNAAETVQGLC
uniref:non-specific serine/threonine protein kinase n=1 Tax=Geotrypetes seraphini TaxID=260995 RepID=A0A6P8R5R4_GEOSA|nr:hormonally up-regulated neu tumor-associated kinase [Geotrypetes seraphini]